VTGGTPFGTIQLTIGQSVGSDPLPLDAICGGLATGLAGLDDHGNRMLDSTGAATWDWPVTGAAQCGSPVQVVDLWSCTTSPVVTVP
jgi:hypothetical protein